MTVLALADLKKAVPVTPQGVDDTWLQSLLDASEVEMTKRYGPAAGPVTEQHLGGLRLITLFRPSNGIAGIASVVEQSGAGSTTSLAANDWLLYPDFMHMARLPYGTNPAARFAPEVVVTFTPLDDTAERKRIQVLLVKQDLAYTGYGGVSLPSGDSRSSLPNYQLERAAILASYSLTGEKYH